MMSKFTRSWALKGIERHGPNVDDGGGGLPPSANGPTYGQQQNGAGGQQPSKPSTAPTASKTTSEPYDTKSAERPEWANSRGYPPHQKEEKRPEMKPEHHRSAKKDNESEVKDHDKNQMIRSPSMSTQSQRDKVLPSSKTEERTSAPADPPASGSPQYSTPQGGLDGTVVAYIVVPNKQVPRAAYNLNMELQSQDARRQRKESKTWDDKVQGGTTAGVQRAASKPRDEIRQTNIQTNGTNSQQQASGFDGMGARQGGNPAPSTSIPAPDEPSRVGMPSQKQNSRRLRTQMYQVAPGGTPLAAPSQEIQDIKPPTRSPPKTNTQQVSQPVEDKKCWKDWKKCWKDWCPCC